MKTKRTAIVLALLAVAVAGAPWLLQRFRDDARFTKARYTKYEYRIPMRDGATLFTQVYLPKDKSKAYPILIQRTPFGFVPYGVDNYRSRLGASPDFDRAGYIFVFQDVRGRFQSQGNFVDMRPHIDHPALGKSAAGQIDESTDMYDTVEWLLKNVPSNNGRVGITGKSYPGFYAEASIIDSHPAIKAASIQAPMTNLFLGDDAYHNGVFQLASQYLTYANFFKPRLPGNDLQFPLPYTDVSSSNGYDFFLKHGPGLQSIAALAKNPLLDDNIQHDTYSDYWQVRDISRHLHSLHCPVLNVGGWFDAEDLAGTFRTYQAIAQQNAAQTNLLVMGPWGHNDWLGSPGRRLGSFDFGSDTGEYFRTQIMFPFFEHYLKDAPAPDLPGALAFETGTNQWRRYSTWPPAGAKPSSFYLRSNGRLSFDPPTAQDAAYDQYVSDPANPVPYVEHPSSGFDEEYMYGDQAFASHRTDVLTYRTDSLPASITISGRIAVRFQISSSATDSDFVVKLIDEDPAGHQHLIRGEPMRAKFRNSFSNPEPLQPNQPTALNYEKPDINNTFLP